MPTPVGFDQPSTAFLIRVEASKAAIPFTQRMSTHRRCGPQPAVTVLATSSPALAALTAPTAATRCEHIVSVHACALLLCSTKHTRMTATPFKQSFLGWQHPSLMACSLSCFVLQPSARELGVLCPHLPTYPALPRCSVCPLAHQLLQHTLPRLPSAPKACTGYYYPRLTTLDRLVRLPLRHLSRSY